MSVKNEHSLNTDTNIKKTKRISNEDCTKTQDEKTKIKKIDDKLNVPIKNEHPLNFDLKIKKTTEIDNGLNKTQIKKAEVKSERGCAKNQNEKADIKSNDDSVKTQNKKVEDKNFIDSKMNLPVKSENLLNIDPEIKKPTGIKDDGCAKTVETENTETQNKKNETQNTDDTCGNELEPGVKERPIFRCQNCNMTERYDYFSDHTPFNRSVRTKIDYYLTKDPFSPRTERQVLILGSICSLCDKDVCIKPECSIFYSQFFCSTCARQNIKKFPSNIQNKIKAAKRI